MQDEIDKYIESTEKLIEHQDEHIEMYKDSIEVHKELIEEYKGLRDCQNTIIETYKIENEDLQSTIDFADNWLNELRDGIWEILSLRRYVGIGDMRKVYDYLTEKDDERWKENYMRIRKRREEYEAKREANKKIKTNPMDTNSTNEMDVDLCHGSILDDDVFDEVDNLDELDEPDKE